MALTYQRKYIACGKPSCRKRPDRHGPYWYAFWFKDGKTRCKYVGKTLPAELDKEDTVLEEIGQGEVSSVTVRRKRQVALEEDRTRSETLTITGSIGEAHDLLGIREYEKPTREETRKKWYNRTHAKNVSPVDLDRLNAAWIELRHYYGWK